MDCERPKVRVNELWIILSGFGYGFLLMWLFYFQLERLYLILYSRSFCSVQSLSSCCSKQFLIQVEEKEI